ncbi:hypothetical protein SOM61_22445 [Massilia sp. CFBP9012]|uniref:hypothetical protein n=1 Tax=Massilia sp. CFBP9012 TaxID=3096531 RepID=UPI002A6A4CB8|nr:hypothetical protein [Massilia sp. CFBP9012]MDY0977726.1 hypothetical protein [Massilia sp. CFBP9012]
MTLPSFDPPWPPSDGVTPRIYALEITDHRRSDRPVAATILVERVETVERDRDGHLVRAALSLHFRRLRPADEKGHFDRRPVFSGCHVPFTPDGPLTVLTAGSVSNGAVFLDLPGLEGLRIGTYLMNEIVVWAKQWPEAAIRPVTLLAAQGHDDNRDRRNRFYEQFGLIFDYSDADRRAGQSRPMLASALVSTGAWRDNLRVIPINELLGELLTDKRRLDGDLASRTRALKDLKESYLRALRHPIWWASGQLFSRLWPF